MTEIIFRLVKALAIFEHVSKSMHRVSRCLSHGVPRILVVLFPLFPTRFFAYVSSSQVCCSEFKFFTLLCHLCKVKPPSESILVDSSLNFTASSSVAPLPIDSVAPRMYGLEVAPNMTLVKWYSLTFLSLKLSNQRTCWASWSYSCTLIWRKAFWISLVTQYFHIWFHTFNLSERNVKEYCFTRSGCSGGPVSKQSLREGIIDDSHFRCLSLFSNNCLVGNVMHDLPCWRCWYWLHNSSGYLVLHDLVVFL